MNKVVLDRHAKRRMKDRGVSFDEVVQILEHPDFQEPSINGRTNAFGFLNGRYLRVTYADKIDHILVITVTIKKKPFKG